MKIYLSDSHSLKDKRQILQSLIDRSRKYNVSIAETGELHKWNYSEISFAVVSNSEQYNQRIVDKVISLFESDFRLTIVNIDTQY